ncbi:MAG: CHAT domain-containing protein, partial [Vulcanimicrobiota bacterium]
MLSRFISCLLFLFFLTAASHAQEVYDRPLIDPATVSDEYFEVIRPVLVKLQRINFSGMFDDRDLVLQELESFPEVWNQTLEKAEAASLSERFNSDFSFLAPEMELNTMRLLAENGLLEEFDSGIAEVLSGPAGTAGKLSLLFTAYRVALRTQSWTRAAGYLAQMEELMDRNERSPVFRYLHQTGVFQLEQARKGSASPERLLERFNSAWGILEGYEPSVNLEEDTHLHLVRETTRFWLDEITALEPAQNVEAIIRINNECGSWLSAVEAMQKTVANLDDRQFLFYGPQAKGYMNSVLCSLDIVMYIVETWKPMQDDRELFAGLVTPFPAQIEEIAQMVTEMNSYYLEDGPGFPDFDLGQAYLLAELRARSRYLLALDPANSLEKKLKHLRDCANLMDSIRQPESYISYQILLGKGLSALGASEDAVAAWTRAYDLATERRFVLRSLEAAVLLGEEWGRLEQWDRASAIALEATRTLEEELDSSAGMAETSQALAQIRTRAAVANEDYGAALVALNGDQQVQAASLRLRGESEGAQATRGLQARRQTLAVLTRKVQDLQERPQSETRNELLEKAQRLLAESKSEFLLESRKLRAKFAQLYTTALRFDPLNLPDVQSVLPEKTAVVQYFPTEHELYIFVVGPGKLKLRSVNYPKGKLEQQVLTYLQRLRAVEPNDAAMARLSKELYSALIQPIKKDVEEDETLVLIPSGKLNLLPFASLQNPEGRYLLQDKTLLELAKPTDFLKIATQKVRPLGKVVIFANATMDLPAAELEGHNIQELFPSSELFTRTEANRENLMKFGQEADVLHLATHGVWDSEDSLRNHLKLANNETLAQEEIFELSLDTSIVTLSACSTALG